MRHGLASLLYSAKAHKGYESAIIAFQDIGSCSYLRPVTPSGHIRKFLSRALRGKIKASFRDWNCLLRTVNERMTGGHHAVEKCLFEWHENEILGWTIGDYITEPFGKSFSDLYDYLPKEKRRQDEVKSKLDWFNACIESVDVATFDASGAYSDLLKPMECYVCGKKYAKVVNNPGGRIQNYVTHPRWGYVCKDERCRAIAYTFKHSKGSFLNPRLPLSAVIEEVSKHAGNNENFRRLAKHFVRHAG